jgi:carboxyl-terminal processing protease
MQHKQQFTSYKTPLELANSFKAGEDEWNELKRFAAKDTIDLGNVNARDKADLLKRIPAQLARQMWRHEGYYEVMNRTDEFVKKAMEVLK